MGIHMKNCPEDTYNLWTPFEMDLVSDYVKNPEAIELFKNTFQFYAIMKNQ